MSKLADIKYCEVAGFWWSAAQQQDSDRPRNCIQDEALQINLFVVQRKRVQHY